MSGLVVPQVVYGLSNEELAELVAKALKEIDWAFNGNISDQNISRIANFLASKTELKHISGIVGMSGYDASNPLAVRFWAGSADKSIAPFRVNQAGQLFGTDAFITGLITGSIIIGSEIKTAEDGVYPSIVLSSSGNIFQASKSATEYIAIDPDYTGSPAMLFESPNSAGFISAVDSISMLLFNILRGSMQINVQDGSLFLLANVDIELTPATGKVKLTNWTKLLNKNSNQTLQDVIDALESQISSLDTDKQDVSDRGNANGYASLDSGGHVPASQIPSSVTPISSVFGRTGAVVAATNDYTWAQINKVTSSIADIATRNLSDLTQTSSFRTATDTEKSTWNGKQAGDATLTALAAFNTNGIMKQTAADTFTAVAAPTGAIVGTTDTQTLTNKSISGSQIDSGTIPVARIPTAIPATSIGGGSVSDTEYGYLDGVTSAIQTQIDGKASATQEAITAPTLTNSWANLGGGFITAGYYKDTTGRVHLSGVIQSGTIGSAAFTLPSGYRPATALMFSTISHDGANHVLTRVDISSAGVVTPLVGGNSFLSLNGISFRP